eukprot:symbB.v1.2.002837.t1/scaffold144.1/size299099/15
MEILGSLARPSTLPGVAERCQQVHRSRPPRPIDASGWPPAATLGSDGSDGSPAATLGSDGSDGSAAGAHGARAAGRPAAAPEARKRPVARLLCVVEPLREVRRTPGHAAARPVCLRNGARRGGGESKLGDVAKTAKLVQGALCVAAAAVPRLAGTGALRGGKAIVPAEEVARQAEEQGRHRSGYAMTVSGEGSQATNSRLGQEMDSQSRAQRRRHQGETHLAAAPAVPQPAKEAAASIETSVELEPGYGARLAMFSARFNEKNKDTENKFRAVHKLLLENHYDVMMVEAGAGESFGRMTAEYLHRLQSEKGIMLAVCTSDYGEMTDSPYSSFAELEYAQEYKLDVLPLQVEDQWKPNPACGEGHQDTKKLALAYISMVFKPSRVRVDCRNLSIEEIACKIAAVLRKGTPA